MVLPIVDAPATFILAAFHGRLLPGDAVQLPARSLKQVAFQPLGTFHKRVAELLCTDV